VPPPGSSGFFYDYNHQPENAGARVSLFGPSVQAGPAVQSEQQNQAQIAQGEGQVQSNFAGFNPDFYNKYTQTTLGAETPQLMNQYATTGKNLTYALARGGNLQSSAAQQENQSLQKQLGANEASIANRAVDQTNALKANVNNQESQLDNQVIQGGSPSAINSQSQAMVAADRAPAAIQPIGNLFADWANDYIADKSARAFQGNGQAPFGAIVNAQYGTSSTL
jgi:hypothetical protein